VEEFPFISFLIHKMTR